MPLEPNSEDREMMFYCRLYAAIIAAGGSGDSIPDLKNKKFSEVVTLLAPNGIVMVQESQLQK